MASMQKRTSCLKFGDLVEQSGLNSVSHLSTKAPLAVPPTGCSDAPTTTNCAAQVTAVQNLTKGWLVHAAATASREQVFLRC